MKKVNSIFELAKKYFAYLLIIISVIAYGSYTGIQKDGLQIVSQPIAFAFYTMVYCSLFLLPFAVYEIATTKHKKHIFSKKTLLPLLLISFLQQFLALLMKLFALTLTTATSVGFITSFSSVTLSIYAVVLLKEKLPKSFFAVLGVMCLGLALFKQKSGSIGLNIGWGEIIMFVFITLTSLSNTIAKMTMSKQVPPFITSFGRAFFATPLLGLLTIATGNFQINHLFSFWPAVAGIVFGFRIVTLYSAVNMTKLSNVAVFNTFVPLITFSYAFLFLGESLNSIQTIGALIILVGAFLMIEIKKNKKKSLFYKIKSFLFKKKSFLPQTLE